MNTEEDRPPDDDDFSSAFENFLASDDTPPADEDDAPPADAPPPDDTPPADEDDTPPADEDDTPPADDDTPPADEDDTPPAEEGGEDDTPPADEDDTPPADDDTPPAGDDDILKRLKNLLSQPAEDDASQAIDDQGDPPADAPLELPPLYTDEEQALLADYEKEWPEVAKAESLRRRQGDRDLMLHIFSEVAKFVQPLNETVENLAVRAQYSDITERNPDYEDIRDQVVEWVDTQPAYLQTAYKQVMKSGTAEEVSDLFDRFRSATGKAAPAKSEAVKRKKNAEPSETAKKAARSMAPVSTKRSAVPQGDDPNDFDAAFRKFAAGKDQR